MTRPWERQWLPTVCECNLRNCSTVPRSRSTSTEGVLTALVENTSTNSSCIAQEWELHWLRRSAGGNIQGLRHGPSPWNHEISLCIRGALRTAESRAIRQHHKTKHLGIPKLCRNCNQSHPQSQAWVVKLPSRSLDPEAKRPIV